MLRQATAFPRWRAFGDCCNRKMEGDGLFLVCRSFLKMKRTVGVEGPLTAFTGRGYWSICTSVTSWWRRRRGGIPVFFALF